MGFLRLFKTPRNQQFEYKPRYWDPKKEEAEERRRRIEKIEAGGVDGMKTRISGGFRKGQGGSADAMRYRNASVRRSNANLVIIMVVLAVLSFLLIEVYFPDMSAWME